MFFSEIQTMTDVCKTPWEPANLEFLKISDSDSVGVKTLNQRFLTST